MEELKIYLRDLDQNVVDAWNSIFGKYPNFDIKCEDIFNVRADAIVSPANSFGYMDGGIDGAYTRYFGDYLQARLQEKIDKDFAGELPVGCATIVSIDDDDILYLISAPTMRIPQAIRGTANAYLAFRAALLAVYEHNKCCSHKIESIVCPGLGTLTGKLHPRSAAIQMREAYLSVIVPRRKFMQEIMRDHYTMTQLW